MPARLSQQRSGQQWQYGASGDPEGQRYGPGGIGAGGGPGAGGEERVRLAVGGAAQESGRDPAQVGEQGRDGVGDREGRQPRVTAVRGGGGNLPVAHQTAAGRGAI